MGKAWDYVQEWLDAQRTDISMAALGRSIGFRQSNFDTWKDPRTIPSREAIGAIADLTGRSYHQVLEAFLEDAGYNVPPTHAEIEAAKSVRKNRATPTVGKSVKLATRKNQGVPKDRR